MTTRDDFKTLNGIPLSPRSISLMAMDVETLMRSNRLTGWVRPVPLRDGMLELLRRAARVYPRRLRVDGRDDDACDLDRLGLVTAYENSSDGIVAIQATARGIDWPGVWVRGLGK